MYFENAIGMEIYSWNLRLPNKPLTKCALISDAINYESDIAYWKWSNTYSYFKTLCDFPSRNP